MDRFGHRLTPVRRHAPVPSGLRGRLHKSRKWLAGAIVAGLATAITGAVVAGLNAGAARVAEQVVGPSSSPSPSARTNGSNGSNRIPFDYTVRRDPRDVLDRLFAGPKQSRSAFLEVTLTGRSARPVVLHGIVPVFASPKSGNLDPRWFDVDTDKKVKQLVPKTPTVYNGGRSADFPFSVTRHEPEVFWIDVRGGHVDDLIALEVRWTSAGRKGAHLLPVVDFAVSDGRVTAPVR